ncbi:hypothetical protein, partial [Paenibacillus xylanexedens]|uniref:hypothetical protein n=1 Tax=Paenibacillus xylanexedens TaxID=528191 RepID=UPI001C92C577
MGHFLFISSGCRTSYYNPSYNKRIDCGECNNSHFDTTVLSDTQLVIRPEMKESWQQNIEKFIILCQNCRSAIILNLSNVLRSGSSVSYTGRVKGCERNVWLG